MHRVAVSQCLRVADQQDLGSGLLAVPASVQSAKTKYVKATHTAQLQAAVVVLDISIETGKEIGIAHVYVLKTNAVSAILSVEVVSQLQQAAAAALNSNVLLASSSGQVTAIANMAHGVWAKAAGAAETMMKVVANGYTGGVRTTKHVWADQIISTKVQVLDAIRGTIYMKWQVRAVQVRDSTLCVIKVMKVTCGT